MGADASAIARRASVSLLESPAYNLAKELSRRLKPLTGKSNHSVDNAQQFLNKIKYIKVA